MTTQPPIRGIYAHVPFCQTICGYCDFYSVLLDRGAVSPLVDALLAELHQARGTADFSGVETLFVGGGTPTTLPTPELRRLLGALRDAAGAAEIEFTVEANPATVSDETAAVLAECGVTRVSIGAQSFDRSELRVLDRIHQPPQVADTVERIRAAGIDDLNLDLIFAVPGQSLGSWLLNLEAALALQPNHLSCYGLTYEKGTPLFERLAAGEVVRAADELEASMYEATTESLTLAGFEQYEISNYARPGFECRHNLLYWRNEPCLGLGPSAAGLVGGLRYKNIADAAEYARAIREGRSSRIHTEQLSNGHASRETMMLGLRLNAGVNRAEFQERFGADPEALFRAAIDRHQSLGLLECTPAAIRLTGRGRLLADSVIADFLA